MAGTAQVFRPGAGIHKGLDGLSPVLSGDARRAAMPEQVDRHGKGGLVKGRIMMNHLFQPQFVASFIDQRGADQSPSVFAHEIDQFGGHITGSGDKITLIFTVFVIDHDDQLALPDIFNCTFYGSQNANSFRYKINNKNAGKLGRDACPASFSACFYRSSHFNL